MFSGERKSLRRRAIIVFAVLLGLATSMAFSAQQPAHAAGNPPPNSNAAPAGGTDNLHGTDHSLAHDAHRNKVRGVTSPDGVTPFSSTISQAAPIIFVHGISGVGGNGGGKITCEGPGGDWSNAINYLSSGHVGLGGDWITQTGGTYTVGYYNQDVCDYNLSTTHPSHPGWAPACGGYYIDNYDPKVGTNNEPLEHVACELAWYIYYNFSVNYQNVKVVSFSMGGLIVRYAIQKSGNDSHFPPILIVSDVVTMSGPLGGIQVNQEQLNAFVCGFCDQNKEMVRDPNYLPPTVSRFMTDITSNAHPNGSTGTDWTMLGSLSPGDPLDWDYQATYLSNSTSADNHRIGYSNVPNTNPTSSCRAQPGWPQGYNHDSSYYNDTCDAYDASYYYCDGCSRDKHSFFSFANKNAPHSLHNMLLAFVYYNW